MKLKITKTITLTFNKEGSRLCRKLTGDNVHFIIVKEFHNILMDYER
jgi:hypothetical protein